MEKYKDLINFPKPSENFVKLLISNGFVSSRSGFQFVREDEDGTVAIYLHGRGINITALTNRNDITLYNYNPNIVQFANFLATL